jgi:hypothetical protein
VAVGRSAWVLVGVGVGGLAALTTIGGYPRSMVGVVGEPVSNMAPPTVPVLFLTLMQCGLVVLVRPHLLAALGARSRVRQMTGWVNEHAMGVYLWHVGGYALAFALLTAVGLPRAERFDAGVWAARPLWIATAAAMTAGLLWLTGSLRSARLER